MSRGHRRDELTAAAFEARLRELVNREVNDRANAGCIECVGCRACSQSTFCRESDRLMHCHYCVDCSFCTDCSHCRGSTHLVRCHHCADSEGCTQSSYLIRCVGLAQCSYCFGCVGLTGKDFHILNEPYERTEYFEITRRLSREVTSITR